MVSSVETYLFIYLLFMTSLPAYDQVSTSATASAASFLGVLCANYCLGKGKRSSLLRVAAEVCAGCHNNTPS